MTAGGYPFARERAGQIPGGARASYEVGAGDLASEQGGAEVAEQTEGSVTISASAEEVMAVIEDYENYPKWNDLKSVKVLKKDAQGRGSEVEMQLKAPVIGDVRYVLEYSYKANNGGVSWTTKEIEGGIKDIKGEYELDELDEDETKVTYRMQLDLKMKLPGFVRRQGEKTIVDGALKGLKQRVESG
jgi:uncharacterized membrane protein